MSCPYRTSFCPQDTVPVLGDGRLDSATVLVGEAPGGRENGRPLTGKVGKELDMTYLPRGGMTRDRVYVTNACKCFIATSGRAPSPELVAHCTKHRLRRELERIRPKRVILMGGTAGSLLGSNFDLELDHGIPREAEILGWKGIVFPTYHPALGIHKSSAMRDLLEDFSTLREVLEGRYDPIRDEYPRPDYRRLTDPAEIREVLEGRYHDPLATDTESAWTPDGYRTWCAQFSLDPGTGYLVRVDDEEAWNEYLLHLIQFRRIVMHNAVHDFEAYRKAGITLDWGTIRDTMQKAYHVGLPQGLKVLGWRLLGVRMQTFEELTKPWALDKALYYLMEAEGEDWGRPEAVPVGGTVTRLCKSCKGKGSLPMTRGGKRSRLRIKCRDCDGAGKVEVPRVYQPQGINQKIARLVGDLLKKGSDVDLWERWDNWEDQVANVERKMGPLPRPCISLVPEEKAIRYACRDADVTGRVYPILRRRAAAIRLKVRGE